MEGTAKSKIPMDIQEAAKLADAFLTQYVADQNNFRKSDDPKDFTLKLRLVQPRPDGETIRLTFHRNGDLGLRDVEFDALAEECIDALFSAHPDIQDFEFEYYYTG
jgi:hypothetical protein